MKFGAQLRNKSVHEWKCYNFDYNDVKQKIKLATTVDLPNRDKAVKVLESTIKEQIDVINLFINSKIGEIKRRIIHIESQLEKCEAVDAKTDQEYYLVGAQISNLSSDLQKLSRFLMIQKIALRKSLKKYTKYSKDNGSLNYKINKYVINNQDSFIHTDLTGLYLELALVYDLIREADSSNGHQLSSQVSQRKRASISDPLHSLNQNESFDFESVQKSTKTFNFLVHYDNLNELKLLLLQNFYLIDESMSHKKQFLKLKKKGSTLSIHDIIRQHSQEKLKSLNTCDQNLEDINDGIYRSNSIYLNNEDDLTDGSEFTMLVFDHPQNLYSVKNKTDPSVLMTENSSPINGFRSLLISAIGGLRKSSNVLIANEDFLHNFLNSCLIGETFEQFYEANKEILDTLDTLEILSIEWVFTKHLKPLVKVSLNKSRFTNSIKPDAGHALGGGDFKCWVSLYSNIKLDSHSLDTPIWNDQNGINQDRLPFALLKISHNSSSFNEQRLPEQLKRLLDSHLVYRIEDSSFNCLTYSLFKQGKLSFTPTWSKVFQTDFDIIKLPPKRPVAPRRDKSKTKLYENSDNSNSNASIQQENITSNEFTTQQRYWNEFENGSDFEDGEGAFFIQVDDDSHYSSFDNFFGGVSVDNIYKVSFKLSKTLSHYFPFLFNSLDSKQQSQSQTHSQVQPDQLITDPYNYGAIPHPSYSDDNESSISSSSSSSYYDLKHSRLAHDRFLIFLALSSSLLSFFLTSVSIGITASLLSYDDVSISIFIIGVLLGSMLISLFFSVLSLCLYMMSESDHRSTLQTAFIWTNFGLVNVMIIGGIVGVLGI